MPLFKVQIEHAPVTAQSGIMPEFVHKNVVSGTLSAGVIVSAVGGEVNAFGRVIV